ncbi:hypothetical protein CGLO_17081 [Colletotrichum gloeosporioides Cg-14]|uniref:Uncharacterized protein n=1 Tax=Colletotrichum gloeosporioides (strain Cg-14) TaxID=1237896 RepID=T0JXI2_COLGC|nr:hypothetical protein CGLO_17081 [Colletotrichum gloeosporioides Cg-14]
MPRSNREIAP